MSELAYVLENFDRHFSSFCGKRILLHGSREYAEGILKAFDEKYHFQGVMTLDPAEKDDFFGKKIVHEEELAQLKPELILFTERVKYEDRAYQSLSSLPELSDTLLYNMYGIDERKVRDEYDQVNELSREACMLLLEDADIVGFEVMDVFLQAQNGEIIRPRHRVQQIYEEARRKNKQVFFSLRRSFDRAKQIAALKDLGITPDGDRVRLIDREGEDLSFRRMREAAADKKILYFGSGFVNEFLLPRCYGIRTVRIHLYFDVQKSLSVIRDHYRQLDSPDADRFEMICREIDRHDVISFDIFDTLVCRRVLFPNDVFRLIAEEAERRWGIDPEKLYDCRIAAEHSRPHRELTEIWCKALEMLERTDISAEEIEKLELDTEQSCLCPREKVLGLLSYAEQHHKTVVLTSDMYICAEKLRKLLKTAGITAYAEIFVSVDHACYKTDGLFEDVKEAFPQKRILHLGDNYEADIVSAGTAGIDAIHVCSVRQTAAACGMEEILQKEYPLKERCLLGMAFSEAFRDPFAAADISLLPQTLRAERFAAASCFPMLAGFLWHLAEKAKGSDGVLFASRDGYILRAMYEELRKYDDSLPPGQYLYANRHSSFQTCMDDPETIEKTYIGKEQDLPSWLENVYGVTDPLPHENSIGRKEYVLLHREEICRRAASARENTLRYFRNSGITLDKNYLFVDFVSIGTTQHYLSASTGLKTKGCYLACPLYGEPYSGIDYYLDEQDDFFISNYMEMEYIMTSPEPSLDHFDDEGKPVFAEETRSEKDLQQIAGIQKRIMDIYSEYLKLFSKQTGLIDDSLPPKLYAAEGYHGIVRERGFDDWIKQKI
ncbi:MAG: hypothetical protein IKF46_03715 [Erysipelotrichaceae bacterium]|nr:hypothetical protein [Erysipelotrichaceae bacterium]